MKEVLAVTGYVGAEVGARLIKSPKGQGAVQVWPQHGHHDVAARLDLGDVSEVRVGATSGGETLVQLILRDGAPVETVIQSKASIDGLRRFHDPALDAMRLAATAKVIVV